jgi:oligopeptide transport system substrate-binding protein
LKSNPINHSARRRIAAITLTCAVGASLVSCADTADSAGDKGGGDSAAYNPISTSGTAPEGVLIPTNTEEAGAKSIIWLIFDGLVRVDPDSGQVINETAESVETEDAVTFTIKLKPDQKFANGEPLTAASFVDAWNWGAQLDNAQKAAGDLAVIKGYRDVHPAEAEVSPTAETISGLTVIDDLTFTVELEEPWSNFPSHLTSVVFSPLPKAFFDDYDAWIAEPIGNGPYQLREPVDAATGAYLELNPNYTGTRVPKNTGVYIRFYTDPDAVYQDVLSDNLDIGSASGGGLLTAQADFGERFITGPGGPNQTLTFPIYDEFWGSENGLLVRRAISQAIDRESIIETVFNGLGAPAKEFTQQRLYGWRDDIPGVEVLSYDVDKAKEWLEQAGGYPYDELPLYYNGDGAHKEWIEAVSYQLRENLGINAVPSPITTFPEFLEKVNNQELTGPWRASEIPFNPGLDDILRNVYSQAGGASSGSSWSSQEFDDILAKGRSATDPDEANDYFNQAQEVLLRELPAIPLWYTYVSTIHSTKVSGVRIAPPGATATHLIEKTG